MPSVSENRHSIILPRMGQTVKTVVSLFFVWQCHKKHILECEEFSTTGKCSKGSKCKLMHRARKTVTARKRKSSLKEENESSKLSKVDFTSDEGFLPLSASDAGLS